MVEDYGYDIYKVLSKIVKLKFGKELNGSGIVLKNLYHMKNMITGKEFYLLELNKTQIKFVTQKDFIIYFIQFVQKNIILLERRYKVLVEYKSSEEDDEVGIELTYKQIDFFKNKHVELLKTLNMYHECIF